MELVTGGVMAGTSHSVVDCLSTYNSTSAKVIMTLATPITITELSELCSSARNLTFRQEQAKHVESSCGGFVVLFYVCSLRGNICLPLWGVVSGKTRTLCLMYCWIFLRRSPLFGLVKNRVRFNSPVPQFVCPQHGCW